MTTKPIEPVPDGLASQPSDPAAMEAHPAPEPLASELALREHQLVALRAAMTLTCWSGVCVELPEAMDWFDAEGRLL